MAKVHHILAVIVCWSGLLAVPTAQAQYFGYVDSEVVVKRMPQYQQAQQELDQLAQQWQKDLEKRQVEIDKLWADYRAEEVMLTPQMRRERMADISQKREELRDYQNRLFGYEGLFYQRQQALMEPLLAKVRAAARVLAKKKRVHFIFDKSADLLFVYSNPSYNFTEELIEEMQALDGQAAKTNDAASPAKSEGDDRF